MNDDNTSYGLLKTLEGNPSLSQRDMAKHLGISLGKINFCLNALIAKGCLKVNNFRNSDNKLAYLPQSLPVKAGKEMHMSTRHEGNGCSGQFELPLRTGNLS